MSTDDYRTDFAQRLLFHAGKMAKLIVEMGSHCRLSAIRGDQGGMAVDHAAALALMIEAAAYLASESVATATGN